MKRRKYGTKTRRENQKDNKMQHQHSPLLLFFCSVLPSLSSLFTSLPSLLSPFFLFPSSSVLFPRFKDQSNCIVDQLTVSKPCVVFKIATTSSQNPDTKLVHNLYPHIYSSFYFTDTILSVISIFFPNSKKTFIRTKPKLKLKHQTKTKTKPSISFFLPSSLLFSLLFFLCRFL